MRSRAVVLLIVAMPLLIGACSSAAPPSTAPTEAKAVAAPRLLIMTAMPLELAPLLERADVADTVVINGRRHYLARLAGVDVVLVAAGISMVNAAMGAQLAIDSFEVSGVVFCGIAGGPGPDSSVGDVVVPAQWAHPQPVRVVRPDGAADEEALRQWFAVDADMLEAARAVRMWPLDLQRCNDAGICADEEPRAIVGGNGVSGPTFVDDREYREWVWQTFRADAIDMETAAIAHVAAVNGVPYLGVRAISDLAGATPRENVVTTFGAMAARNAAAFLEVWLQAWGEIAAQGVR